MNPAPLIPHVRHASPHGYVDALPGIRRKALVEGVSTQLIAFRLARSTIIPLHQHPQEQTGFLVSGRLVLTMAGTDHEMRPGDAWAIPGTVEHSARVLEDTVVVEVFSPPRADYRQP